MAGMESPAWRPMSFSARGADFLSFGVRRLHLFVLQQRSDQVAEHGRAVAGGPTQFLPTIRWRMLRFLHVQRFVHSLTNLLTLALVPK
jgi:hypothetical protein